MHRTALILTSSLVLAGCSSHPSFPPPEQRASMGEAGLGTLGHFVYMSQSDADAYIAGGMRSRSEGPWRWALANPVLRFYLPEVGRLRFRMDFTLPEHEFHQTGPVILTVAVNGSVVDRIRCDKPGKQQYEHAVPAGLLHANGENLVAITPDKTSGEERLGFVLTSAGFAE